MVAMARAWSAISVAVDVCVALLPIPLLRGTRLRPAVQVALGAILGLGVFASAATAVRIPALPLLAVREGYLWNVGWVAMWAFLETGVALCAAALTSLRPLLGGWLVGEGGGRGRGAYHRQWWSERAEGERGREGWGGREKWRRVLRVPRRAGGGRRRAGKEGVREGGFVGLEVCREWERGVQDSWETTLGGESSIGMRTVVVEGGEDVDAESQKSIVGEGDIKVRKSICVEVPDE
ncbi:hypothetical protein GTA08_BOTSDO08417 [Neofusicoccum parvum]|uniref:Uncharacterized protein n=1 Tax=Neofusicoccum parvum TaxID=310453 RepID=A0ACB5SP34_9PEZI|nr:hypothetical protein GTA08_BOTSDO08417 [Neofusicoccum parvum]